MSTSDLEGWGLTRPALVEGEKSTYEGGDGSVSLTGSPAALDVTPENIEVGQKFTSEDTSGVWNYEVVSKNGKAYVKVIGSSYAGEEYELKYSSVDNEWYYEGSTGTYILTPVEEF